MLGDATPVSDAASAGLILPAGLPVDVNVDRVDEPVPSVAEVIMAMNEVDAMWERAGAVSTVELSHVVGDRVTITDEGFAIEAATTRVGEMLGARADQRIVDGMAALRAEYGLDPDVDLSVFTSPPEMVRVRIAEGLGVVANLTNQQSQTPDEVDAVGRILASLDGAMRGLEAREQLAASGLLPDIDELQERIIALRADAYLQTLAEVREYGAEPEIQFRWSRSGLGTSGMVADAVQHSAGLFPPEWREMSNGPDTPLLVEITSDQVAGSYYQSGTLALGSQVPDGSDGALIAPAVCTHEMTHHMERVVTREVDGRRTFPIAEMEEAFLQRRTGGGPGVDGDDRDPLVEAGPLFSFRPDHFATMYVGCDYQCGPGGEVDAREVLSVAMESMFHGTTGGLVGDSGYPVDRDHRAFALGVLATIGRRRDGQ